MKNIRFYLILSISVYIIIAILFSVFNNKNEKEISCIVISDVQYISYEYGPHSICDCYDYKNKENYQINWYSIIRKHDKVIIQEEYNYNNRLITNLLLAPLIGVIILVFFLFLKSIDIIED